MSEFEVDLGDGRTVVVDAPDAAQAASAARMFIAREKGSKPQDATNADRSAFARGLGFGFADEIGSAIRATVGPAVRAGADMLGVGNNPDFQSSPIGQSSQAPTWGARYDEELARTRAQAKSDKAARPGMTTAGELAGTLASTGALMALPGGQTLLGGGATSLGGGMLRGAASGAALGGVQGFGEGEGGLDPRLKSAGTGAAVGGVVGGVLPAVGSGAGYLYEKMAPGALRTVANVADRFTTKAPARSGSAAAPEGGMVTQDSLAATIADNSRIAAGNIEGDAAAKRLALEIARSGGSTQARQRLADLGEGAFLADTSKGATRLANLGAILPGEAGEKYTAAFGQRNRETGQRFLGAMGEQANVPSVFDAQQFLTKYRSAEGSRIYDPVLRSGQFNVSPEMDELLKVPAIREAMDQVIKDAEKHGIKVGAAEAAHMVKQQLNRNTEAAFQSGSAVNKDFVRQAGDAWEQALWSANPAIKDADTAYAKVASLYDPKTGEGWLKRGGDFMKSGQGDAAVNVSPSALAADLPGATPQQLQTFRVGSSNVMRDAATSGPETTRRLAKSIADNQITQQKLSEIYGPEVADRLIRQSETERLFQETRNRVLAGSPTAERLTAAADDAALSIPQGGGSLTPASIFQFLADKYAQVRQPGEAVRSRLADLLANGSTAANAETLALAEELLRRQATARPINAGVAGATGGNMSSPR